MGDLRGRIPTTYWTMFIATLAIAGIPPFAGFFSKDEILWQAWTSESVAYHLLWIIGYATALMTAFYMNLGAFGVITSLRHRNIAGDDLDDLNGLYSRAPVEAVLMLVFMLSLAGIPPLAGFWGKYFIFLSLIESKHYVLAALGVLYSVFGLYYYLKIANAMFMRQPEKGEEKLPVSLAMRVALGLTGLATLYIGILPNRFIEIVNWALGIAQQPSVAKIMH